MSEHSGPTDPPRPSGQQPGWYAPPSGRAEGTNGSSAAGWPDAPAADAGAPSYGEHAPGPGRQAYGGAPAYDPAPAYGAGHPAYGYTGRPLAPGQSQGTALSLSSMIIGILTLVGGVALLFPPIVGVVLGHMGLRREPNGRGMAIAGLVMNYIGVALVLLMVVAVVLMIAMGLSLASMSEAATSGLNA